MLGQSLTKFAHFSYFCRYVEEVAAAYCPFDMSVEDVNEDTEDHESVSQGACF